jgi:hypothetical protein
VETMDKVQYEEVTESGVWILRGKQKARQFLDADLIVLSTGFQSNASADTYSDLVANVVVTGDANQVSNMTSAINNIYLEQPD